MQTHTETPNLQEELNQEVVKQQIEYQNYLEVLRKSKTHVSCACSKGFHKIEKTRNGKRITCNELGIECKSSVVPILKDKWYREVATSVKNSEMTNDVYDTTTKTENE